MNVIKDVLNIGPSCVERFIDLNVLASMEDLDIELAGCSNLRGQYQVSRSYPADHTLFYTLSGEGNLKSREHQFALLPNTLAILPAKQAFDVQIVACHWDVIWINLADTKRWQHLNLESALVLSNQKLDSLHFAMEILYSESNPVLREAVKPIVSYYLDAILLGQSIEQSNSRIQALFKEVDKRLQFDWSIDTMCEFVHYSPPHLHRLCQAELHKSPIQQLIHLRIRRAQKLLLNTAWPISHIANYVGYQNSFHFSKRFKQSVGVSPTEYRRAQYSA